MNNRYTLYIDESGDFESPRGQWVIAGLLVDESYEDSERLLNAKFAKLPSSFGERSKKDFHLTEFRSRYGHEEAIARAGQTLGTLDKLAIEYNFISVINFTKTKAQFRERTYRLMLADMLAMLETVLPSKSVINHLDIVVATRTIKGVRQTSVSDIDHDIIESLPFAMEIDLATRGLVDLLGKHLKVRMEYAIDSWGLVCADFIANINYHRDKEQERAFLDSLEANGKFAYFESFGGFEARRARVAERNGDFSAALHQWIAIINQGETKDEVGDAIQRILRKVFNRSGSSGADVVFEALLERIWRQGGAPQAFSQVLAELQVLEHEFEAFLNTNTRMNYDYLQFRLRNLILIACNHLGLTTYASEVITLQSRKATSLATNPEYFNWVLDYRITATETLVNKLEIEDALLQALEYSKIVENYYEVWRLLVEQDELDEFHTSRFSIKTETSLIRLCVIAYGVSDVLGDLEISKKLDRLEGLLRDPRDKSRLLNYRIMFLLKQRRWSEAIEVQLQRVANYREQEPGEFDVFWFLRAINDGLLNGVALSDDGIVKIIDGIIGNLRFDRGGHPYDLIAREVGLYYYLNGDSSRAKKMLRKSKSAAIGTDAPISKFLQSVLKVHEDFIFDRESNVQECFKSLEDSSWVSNILREDSGRSLLQKLRYYSPY